MKNTKTLFIALATVSLSLLFTTAGVAQQIGNPTTQQGVTFPRGVYAIRNARVITVSGPTIENGTVVIRDGKIESVGPNVTVPGGAQVIDAQGLWVYPGMFDAGTSLGLVEVWQGAARYLRHYRGRRT
jgi:hypothetical protein